MAERSGFFNALYSNGEYDRKYNANDYSDNLAVVIGNGVLRSIADDLRVTASGMVCTVAAGRAWINGKYYHNDAPLTFAAVTAPAGGTRWDRIVLRLNTALDTRSITLQYVQGEAADSPTKPEPVRSGDIYELVIADVYVSTNATSVIVTDTRGEASVCGWVYSTAGDNSFFTSLDNSFAEWFGNTKDTLASVTLFKRYTWRTILAAAAQSVNFSIPQYDEETCFLEVYVNGVLDVEGVDFTRNGNIITFANSLVAGTEIVVKAYKSIDGTGIMSVADEITELQNAVAALNTASGYDYICNGVDDNVKLSEIAQAWLTGGNDDACKTIRVYGTFGATAAYGGDGSSTSPYRWISVGRDYAQSRRIVFDFSSCSRLDLPIAAGTYNHVFYGADAHIIGANLRLTQMGAGTVIRAFSTAGIGIRAENCRFYITGYQDSCIANTGTFNNCYGYVMNATGNSYCFLPVNASLLRVNGGEYYAYTGTTSGANAAVVGQSASNAVSILNGINAPAVTSWDGSVQTHAILQMTGGGYMNCSNLVSDLPISVISGRSNVSGTIVMNKAGAM